MSVCVCVSECVCVCVCETTVSCLRSKDEGMKLKRGAEERMGEWEEQLMKVKRKYKKVSAKEGEKWRRGKEGC